MVPVSQDHGIDVALPPIVEEAGIVVLCLALRPDVERLIQNQQTQTITRIEEGRRRRIVGCAYRIETGGFEEFYFSRLCAVESRSPERAIVMVNAAAREFDCRPVEEQALLHGPRK